MECRADSTTDSFAIPGHHRRNVRSGQPKQVNIPNEELRKAGEKRRRKGREWEEGGNGGRPGSTPRSCNPTLAVLSPTHPCKSKNGLGAYKNRVASPFALRECPIDDDDCSV
eukprot:3247026-Rhodomonas_salina.4